MNVVQYNLTLTYGPADEYAKRRNIASQLSPNKHD